MLVVFTLVLARVLGLFLGAPVFSQREIPRRYRILLAGGIAVGVLPGISPDALPADGAAVAWAMVGEVAVGFSIGLLARLTIAGFQLAGQLIGFQAGFAVAQAFDPDSGAQSPLLSALYVNLVTVLFLLLDGHHLLIRALAASYDGFPLGSHLDAGLLARALIASSGTMFEIGARVAAPVTGVLLLANASIGFLNRLMPQLGIFNIGFPMTVAAGLGSVLIGLPGVAHFFQISYAQLEGHLALLVAG
ncbi:MAG: flagellar biosynthetic protein FliR [Myxococcota bacterium]